MRRPVRRLALAALLSATATVALAGAAERGAVVPFFKAADLQGRPVALGDLVARHRVLILFWDWRRATSTRAMQACDRLQQSYGRLGLEVMAIEGEGSAAEQVRERVEKLRAIGNPQRYTIVPDPRGSIARQFGFEGTPQIFLLDGAGRVVLHLDGFRADDEAVLEQHVKETLGLAEPVPPRAPTVPPPAAAVSVPVPVPTAPAPQPVPPEDPKQAQLEKYRYFGGYYLNRGDLAKAEDNYRKYVELAPEDVRIWLQLGEVCARQRRYDQAREAWEKVLHLDPGNSEADTNIRRLIRGEY